MMAKLLSTLFMMLMVSGMFAQVYQFKFFGRDYGLPQPFVYTINQTPDGFLWAGTGEGLTRFDGRNFRNFTTKDGLAEDFVTTSYVDKKGNLWLGHNQGGLTYYNGKRFHVVARGQSDGSSITDLREDPYGNIWASTKGAGLMKMDRREGLVRYTQQFHDHIVYALEMTQNELLVANAYGLFTYGYKNGSEELKLSGSISAFEGKQINTIRKRFMHERYWIATDRAGLYELRVRPGEDGADRYQVNKVAPHLGLEQYNIVHVTEDSYGNLWLSTFGHGIMQLTGTATTGFSDVIVMNRSQGFAGDFIKGSYEDREKNIWIATYGNGLAMRANDYFAFYPVDRNETPANSITADQNGVWTGQTGTINFFDPLLREKKEIIPFLDPEVEITAICSDSKGTVVAGTNGKGVYLKSPGSEKLSLIFAPEDKLSRFVTSILSHEGDYIIATQGGLYRITPQGKVVRAYNTLNGLLHNTIYQIGKDSLGHIWIANQAPKVQIVDTDADTVGYRELDYTDMLIHMNGIQPTREGTWISTYGSGVYLVSSDSVYHYDDRSDLSSNYCYGIVLDKRGYIWAMHRNTLSRIGRGDRKIRVYTPGGSVYQDLGFHSGDCDRFGNIWFATEKGLLRYFPDRDKRNTIPPLLRIRTVFTDEKPLPDTVETPSMDYNTFRVRFALQGLSLRDPHMVRYRYMLQGYDREWSDPTDETVITYTRLPDGEYTFLAEAMNADGIRTASPVKFSFIIEKPFWKKWWFAVAVALTAVQGTYTFIRFRERKHRKIKQMLKQMLDERTKVVLVQKEELEKKNKDITDSISYARRIQWAMLPDISQLRQVFPESFILYRPKDIVSGDFYWMKKFGNKFLVACADATGHGVPGAFMSMIGSTLLKDITELGEVSDTASVLTSLDHQVRSILSKQGQVSANDGMDIALCEIDSSTGMLSFSLAMRPLVIVRNGEHIIYKGNRKAIGGIQHNNDERFTTHTIQLEKGDMIYLFTDGYQDQFGGSKGKKLKLTPFIKGLEQASWLPADKQQLMLERKFHHWMGKQEQVDDVLLIGIRYT